MEYKVSVCTSDLYLIEADTEEEAIIKAEHGCGEIINTTHQYTEIIDDNN